MRGLGYLLIITTALLWATNGPTASFAFDAGVEPSQLAALRVLGSALLLGPLAIAGLRRLRGQRLGRRDLLALVLFGTVGIMAAQYLFYAALGEIDVAVALVIIYMNPLVVALYERVRHGERLPRRAQWAMALAIGGVVLMVAGRDGGIGRISTIGLGLAAATMVAASAQIVLAGRLPRALTPVQRTGAGMVAAAVGWLIVVPAWTLPWGELGEAASLGARLDGEVPLVAIVVWITVLGTAAPYLALVAGAARIGSGATSVVTMLEPAVGAVLAWVLLGQSLAPLQIVGVVAALTGVLLVELARTGHATPAPAPG